MQRFKGTEPEEELSEQVKEVKIEDKPKEVKAEVVDEVPAARRCPPVAVALLSRILCVCCSSTGSTQVHQGHPEERR